MFSEIGKILLEEESFSSLHDYIKRLRNNGVSSEDIVSYLEKIYKENTDLIDSEEDIEEKYNSIMDLLTGWCSPSQSLK